MNKKIVLLIGMLLILTICVFVFIACDNGPNNNSDIILNKRLQFELNDDGTEYIVTGIGSFDGNELIIPSVYRGKPVTEIGDRAFSECIGLKSVVIPESIKYIGHYAFRGCRNIEKMTIPFVGNGSTITNFGVLFGNLIYTGGIETRQYNSSDSSSYSTYYIPSSLKSVTITGGDIPYCAFYNCSNLTNISIGSEVTSIDKYAFKNCINLTSITISDSVTSIGYGAFYGCGQLASVAFGKTSYLTSIGDKAFELCSSLTYITIPDKVISIGEHAFSQCNALAQIVYYGTKEEWNKLVTDNNGELYKTITVICSDGEYDFRAFNIIGYDGSEVTITFYHTMGSNLRDVLEDYIAEFNNLYPNIHIEHEQVGDYDDVRNQISTEITAGNQPNIAYCYPDHVALYNVAGAVVQLDNYIASDIEVTRNDGTTEILGLTRTQIDDFIEGFYNEGKQFGDDKMYSMPMSKSTEVLYYNKTFFDANNLTVPATWDEMEEVCEKIKEIDPDCIPLGYDSEANWFITMCEQYGSPYTSATGEHFLFDNDTNKNFVQMIKDWYNKGYVTTQKIQGAYTSGLFTTTSKNRTKSYMSIGSSAGATHQRPDKVDGAYPFEVGIATIPQVSQDNRKVISQGPSLCIFGKDNDQEVVASWLFVKYLTTCVEFQAEFSMVSGYVPVLKSVAENETYAAFLAKADGTDNIAALTAKVCMSQEEAYCTCPAFVGSSKAREQVGQLIIDVIMGKKTIDEAFEDANDACESYVANSNNEGVPNVLKNAIIYLNVWAYEHIPPMTDENVTLMAKSTIFDIDWSITTIAENLAQTDKIEIQVIENVPTIVVPQKASTDINYTLKAVISDGTNNVSLEWNLTVPKWRELTWTEYNDAKTGDSVVVKGYVVGIIAKSKGSAVNSLYLQDADGGYYVYALDKDPVTKLNLKEGMLVRVTGKKDVYSGILEIKDASIEILDEAIAAQTPVDYTEIYKNAKNLKDTSLVEKQGLFIAIKGVTLTSSDANKGHYKFTLGGKESYIRISSSVCPLTKDEQATMIANYKKGYIADVTGVVCVLNGAFYLTPVDASAIKLGSYAGNAIPVTLQELRCNIDKYNNKKVAVEGIVARDSNDGIYLESEEADLDTELHCGIYCYYGYNLSGAGLEILTVGNKVLVVGTVLYYETGGTYQISGMSYKVMKPNDPDNLQRLDDKTYDPAYQAIDAGEFANGTVYYEYEDEEGAHTMSVKYAEYIMDTTVLLENLKVTKVYTTNNEEPSSSEAMTLTCTVGSHTITVCTDVLYDGDGNLITESAYMGKTISVKGVVAYFNGYQVKVFSAKDITVLD